MGRWARRIVFAAGATPFFIGGDNGLTGAIIRGLAEARPELKLGLVVIDSINGYLQSMPEERLLPIQIHELLSYLSNNGVTSIMTLVQHGIFGNPVDEAAEVSYLADTVVLMRYFEVAGSVRQAISVVKKRSGDHERTIRGPADHSRRRGDHQRLHPGFRRRGEPGRRR